MNESLTLTLSLLQNIFLCWLVDGKLDRGAPHNETLLFKDNLLQHITTSDRFLELVITVKCRAQIGNSLSGEQILLMRQIS